MKDNQPSNCGRRDGRLVGRLRGAITIPGSRSPAGRQAARVQQQFGKISAEVLISPVHRANGEEEFFVAPTLEHVSLRPGLQGFPGSLCVVGHGEPEHFHGRM